MGPKFNMTVVFTGRGQNRDTDTEEKSPCDDGDRDWSDAAIKPGMPRIVSNHQKPREIRKGFSSQPSQCCQHLEVELIVSITARG
jgi:hypothetical protein